MQRGLILLLSLTALTGCMASRASGLAEPVGPAEPAAILHRLNGGLIGRAGLNELGSGDLERGLEAEYRALEYAVAGTPVAWRGRSSLSGEVTAAQPYRVGSQDCRSYMHLVRSATATRTLRGTACRNPDGSWTPLT